MPSTGASEAPLTGRRGVRTRTRSATPNAPSQAVAHVRDLHLRASRQVTTTENISFSAEQLARGGATAGELHDLDGVRELLLDGGVVRDYQHLPETAAQALEREQHAFLAVVVERAEDLVEHEQPHGAPGLEANVFTDRDAQRKVGQIDLRAGEAIEVERSTGVEDADAVGLGVDFEPVVLVVGQRRE